MKEQRVVLKDNTIFGLYRMDEKRHVKYDFEELDGIIWESRIGKSEKEDRRSCH